MLALLLAAAVPAPVTAIDAERAFAAMAQAKGQWTAFRHYAAPEGMMFVPEPVKAQEWLKDRKDPPQALRWSPTASFVSCDGSLAVNTGEWTAGKGAGFFSTVWQRKTDGDWHWLVDAGDDLPTPRAATPTPLVWTAACGSKPAALPGMAFRSSGLAGGRGMSTDGTLVYQWDVRPNLTRQLWVWLWNGSIWAEVMHDSVGPPKK